MVFQNINSISVDTVLVIQKDLEPYDMTSLVFLLYEIPDTALQRLTVYQKVSKDIDNDTMNLLHHWASHAQTRPSWKHELLEALCICRLYNIIRKLGFDVTSVKHQYQPSNMNFTAHISIIKKILYRLCESVNSELLLRLKKTLLTYGIDTTTHESCELILLELMCQKFVVFKQTKEMKIDFSKLTEILEHFPSLCSFASLLTDVENKLNKTEESLVQDIELTTPTKKNLECKDSDNVKVQYDASDLDEFYEHFNQLNLNYVPSDLTTDKRQSFKDSYPILNPKRVGVCCIINQEEFHPSKENITHKIHIDLTTRHGSTKDQIALENIMSSLNFEVMVRKNLDHKEFIDFIKHVLKNCVHKDDSVFVLCILSHGVRGHVYAANSVKIKVEDIQTLLDTDIAINLYGKPKVLILQACQVDEEPSPASDLVADGPSKFFLRKSDFLIYWATAPEYEAFRQTSKGSLFIQFLCIVLKKRARNDHIYDIFTRVTDIVTNVCSTVRKQQVPIFESTLRRKLYLYKPL
ncbi:unnamed protein product [Leptosia nina]|uniref:Caspase-8 n=1 Tax=Leptosia nina TaxID=320188 RepID=A0AAV1J8H0_9NEOP